MRSSGYAIKELMGEELTVVLYSKSALYELTSNTGRLISSPNLMKDCSRNHCVSCKNMLIFLS